MSIFLNKIFTICNRIKYFSISIKGDLSCALTPILQSIKQHCLLFFLILVGLIYVANTWTPSSYGILLNKVGIHGYGPVSGKPQAIRSDEWAVSTPYFQIAVRNEFQRYNQFSPYKEDLRSFLALPLKDWALIFRPQMWAFYVLDPAYAYSFYYYFLFFSFIFGFYQLFISLGSNKNLALIGTLLLFFSRFTQVWWSNNASVLSLAPWLGVVFLSSWRWPFRFITLLYSFGLWIFGMLYPPFMIPTIFVLGVLIIAFRPDRLRYSNIILGVTAGIVAAWLGLLYYGDLIEVMNSTIYPGNRVNGGGGEHPLMIFSHLLPYITAVRFESSIGLNDCEIGTVSSFFPLMMFIFSDYRALKKYVIQHKRSALILLIGLILIVAWIYTPVPATVGKIFLWHRVPARRMFWGFGLLLTMGLIIVSEYTPWYFSIERISLFAFVVLISWVYFQLHGDINNLLISWFDGVVLIPLTLLVIAKYKFPLLLSLDEDNPKLILGWAAVFTSLATFGLFNPLQSAKPIFHTPDTPAILNMKEEASYQPQGWLLEEGGYGACLNGLGLNSIAHVLMTPKLSFFRPIFADIPEERFNEIFNRYAHVVLSAESDVPEVPAPDVVILPLDRFYSSFHVNIIKQEIKSQQIEKGGKIDNWKVKELDDGTRRIVLHGWAPFSGWHSDQALSVFSNQLSIEKAWATRTIREDITASLKQPHLRVSGFTLILNIREKQEKLSDKEIVNSLVIESEDITLGKFILPSIPN